MDFVGKCITEFGVEFSITEIDNMKNVGDMLIAIKQKI